MIWQFIKYLFHPTSIAENFTFFSGGGTSTVQQKSFTPEEEAMRKLLMSTGKDIYDQTQGQYTAAGYPGAAPVPASPQTIQARQMLQDTATGQGSAVSAAAGQALQFGLKDVLYPESNPALQATIDTATRQVGQAYTDPGGVISRIKQNFTAGNSGGTSTRESIAGGLAARSYLDTVGDVTGKLASQGYQAGLDTFGRTMAFAPQAYNLMTQPAQTMAQVGGSVEAEQAALNNFESLKKQYALNAPWMGLQNLSNVFTGTANPATTSTANTQSNPVMNMAGGAMAGWALGAQMGASYGPYGAAAGAFLGLLMS